MMPKRDRRMGAKQRRDYRLILGAAFFYGLVDGLLFITMALYVDKETHGSLPMVGFISSLPFLAIFIMSFIWGAVSDRLGSYKGVIIGGNIITGLMFFPMPFLNIYHLFGLRAIQVFFYSANVLAVAVVTEMLPDTKGEAAGIVSMYTSAGWLVGGIASGFVYFYGDVITLFPVCGIMAMMTGFMLVPMGKLDKIPVPMTVKESFRFEKGRPIGLLLVIICLTYIANRAVFTLFPVYLENIHELTAIPIGILSASAGLVGAIVVVFIGRFVDRRGRRPMLIFAVALYLIDWLVLVLTDNLVVVIIIWCIPSWVFMTISATAMVSDLTSSKERGRGIGALNSALNLGQFVGAVTSGVVAELFVQYWPDLGPNGFNGLFLFATLFLILPLAMAFGLPETLPKGKEGVREDASEE
jgi:MFS family permease